MDVEHYFDSVESDKDSGDEQVIMLSQRNKRKRKIAAVIAAAVVCNPAPLLLAMEGKAFSVIGRKINVKRPELYADPKRRAEEQTTMSKPRAEEEEKGVEVVVEEETLLFQIDPAIIPICPKSFVTSMRIATKIIRSTFFQQELSNLYFVEVEDDEGNIRSIPHIDAVKLKKFLDTQRDLFVIDKFRLQTYLNSRACTIRYYDPWKVYFNPLYLMEMKDREDEVEEYENYLSNPTAHTSLIAVAKHFDELGNPTRVKHNSLIHSHQVGQELRTSKPPKKKLKTSPTEGLSVVLPPAQMIPSGLSLEEKHILMTVVLLVHECSHLLNYAFSAGVDQDDPGTFCTPEKKMRATDKKTFRNIGHMMELQLFGFVIQHAIDELLPSPFGIHEIIGADHEQEVGGRVLQPSPTLMQFLRDKGKGEFDPNKQTLSLHAVSEFLYTPKAKPVLVGIHKSAVSVEGEEEEVASPPAVAAWNPLSTGKY